MRPVRAISRAWAGYFFCKAGRGQDPRLSHTDLFLRETGYYLAGDCLAGQPDEGGHPAGLAVATIGVKLLAIAEGAVFAAIDGGNAGTGEA